MKRRWPKGTWMKLKSKEVLKALIQSRDLSYGQIGQAAGCHRSMISALANGHRPSCTPDLADRIAVILGVPTEVIFDPKTSAASVDVIPKQRRKTAA